MKNQINLTNLNKIFWPKKKYTKGDVMAYYQKIAPYILPYLKDRPENLNRHPNGIKGKSFFQKDVDHTPPSWVKTARIYSQSNKKYLRYLLCNDKATLIYLTNLGCIEINPWSSRIQSLDKPDYLVIDLDPLDVGFNKVVKTAQTIRQVLESVKINSYPKTSGATGLHIYMPLGTKYTYEQAKNFAKLIAGLVNKKIPSITSIERNPAKRRGKVYLDYLQNSKGQTLAAPYSLRPRPGATVSTPLKWSEVKSGLDPKKFTIQTIFARVKKTGDLFKPVLGPGINLKQAFTKFK